jgi:MFS superfamily sulfate permease-like transporter
MAIILHPRTGGRQYHSRALYSLLSLPSHPVIVRRSDDGGSSRDENSIQRWQNLGTIHHLSKRPSVSTAYGTTARGIFSSSSLTTTSVQRLHQVRYKSTEAANSLVAATLSTKGREAVDDDESTEKDNSPSPAPSPPTLLLDFGLPALLPEWRKMFRTDTLFTDVSAGLTVGCIAVPLSLAIAVASGVPAEVGLVTAAVSGVAGGLLGGTTLAITGPAAAISLLVVSAVQEHGLEALPFITLACGGLQLASGVTRLGVAAKVVPVSVIAGFTTGVGTLILSGQVPKALGMSNIPTGMNPLEVAVYIGENLSAVSPAAASLALGTSAAMYLLPKVHPKIPSALLAVGGATVATQVFDWDVSLIGAIPSGLEAFQFALPVVPAVESLPSLCMTVGLIYAMTSVESLLSCVALEKMKKTGYKHDPDQELVGQGVANVASAMFMGMPVTSVIARSGLNVRLGAETRLPALVQAGFVFSSVVFLSDQISMIPMPALSGMLITTGMSMLNPTEFKHCYAVQKIDAIPFAATVAGMISFGLAEGIGVGFATAVALNYRNWNQLLSPQSNLGEAAGLQNTSRMQAQEATGLHHTLPVSNKNSWHGGHPHAGIASTVSSSSTVACHANPALLYHPHQMQMQYTTTVQREGDELFFQDADGRGLTLNPSASSVWHLHGPINFLSMFAIDDMIRTIKGRTAGSPPSDQGASPTHTQLDAIVLDMANVTSVEFTGIEELVNRLMEVSDYGSTPVRMVNVNETLHNALDQCDPSRQISRYSTLTAAAAVLPAAAAAGNNA